MDYICERTIDCNQSAVRAIRFNVDGNYCISCGSDKKLKLWNPNNGLFLKTYSGHAEDVLDACSSCDSSQVVSGGADKSVILWDVVTGQVVRRLRAHAGRVTTVSFNEESTVVVSGSNDNTVMCWDVKSRQNNPVQVLREANDCITRLKVTNHEILTGSLDCKIRRYDIRSAEIIVDFVGEPVTSVCYTADEQCILVSCSDSTIKLFDRDTGDLLGEYTGHSTGDYYIESCIDNTDSYVLSGSVDGTIWSWNVVEMSKANQFVHTKGQVVHSLAVHPSKKCFLSASGDNVKYWKYVSDVDEST